MPPLSNNALLLAAGSGQRMGPAVADKILASLRGKPVLVHSVDAFERSGCVEHIRIVYRDARQRERLEAALHKRSSSEIKISWARGGPSRQESVHNGLNSLPESNGLTFIHDAARPLITPASIAKLAEVAGRDGAACLAHPLVDTVKRIADPSRISRIELEDLERNRLWAMETPQVYRAAEIRKAYQHVKARGLTVTDDAAAAAAIGLPVTLVPNEKTNPKITTTADLSYLEWLLSR